MDENIEIVDLLAKKREAKKSLEEISSSLNMLTKPLVIGVLTKYQTLGGTWPGLRVEKITAGVNKFNGVDFEVYDVQNVLLELVKSGEIRSEESGCYSLDPFKKYPLTL